MLVVAPLSRAAVVHFNGPNHTYIPFIYEGRFLGATWIEVELFYKESGRLFGLRFLMGLRSENIKIGGAASIFYYVSGLNYLISESYSWHFTTFNMHDQS